MVGQQYTDSMDRDRILIPEKDLGLYFLCRVYFRNTGYCGKIKIKKSLFDNDRYGFFQG